MQHSFSHIHFSVEAEQEVFLKKKLKLPPTSSTIKNMCERVILFLFICQFRVCLSSFCYQQWNKFTKWSVGACSRSRYSPWRRAFLLGGNINSWCVCNGQIYDIFVSIKLSAEIGLKCKNLY